MLNTLEVYGFDVASCGCHLQQTFFNVDIKGSFSQIYLFMLNFLTFRFRAKAQLLLTTLFFDRLQIFIHQFQKTDLLKASNL